MKFANGDFEIGFHVYKSGVYLPTFALTDAGFYLPIDPFDIAELNDSTQLKKAILSAVSRGNPLIRAPLRHEYGKPAVLKYANVDRWSKFEKLAAYWKLSRVNNRWSYGPYKKREDRGWEEDASSIVEMEVGATVEDAVDALVTSLQAGGPP